MKFALVVVGGLGAAAVTAYFWPASQGLEKPQRRPSSEVVVNDARDSGNRPAWEQSVVPVPEVRGDHANAHPATGSMAQPVLSGPRAAPGDRDESSRPNGDSVYASRPTTGRTLHAGDTIRDTADTQKFSNESIAVPAHEVKVPGMTILPSRPNAMLVTASSEQAVASMSHGQATQPDHLAAIQSATASLRSSGHDRSPVPTQIGTMLSDR